jgi:hypothetical protein
MKAKYPGLEESKALICELDMRIQINKISYLGLQEDKRVGVFSMQSDAAFVLSGMEKLAK